MMMTMMTTAESITLDAAQDNGTRIVLDNNNNQPPQQDNNDNKYILWHYEGWYKHFELKKM